MRPIRDVTVGALLSQLATLLPEHEALVYTHGGPRLTFRALDDEARLVARGLVGHGVRPGDRVAVWATNVPEWVVLQFALAKIGAILVTVNTALRAQEIEYLLRQSETSTLVTIAGFRSVDYLAELRSIGAIGSDDVRKERLPHLERVVFRRPRLSRRPDPLRSAGSGRCQRSPNRSRCARIGDRSGRRDQHAVHVRHDRLSERRDAVEPQHRQQRLLAWPGPWLYARRPVVLVRPAVSLLRVRHRRARCVHPRCLPVCGRVVRPSPRSRDDRA